MLIHLEPEDRVRPGEELSSARAGARLIDRGAHGDRERHAGVPDVALHDQDEHCDEQDRDRPEPRDASEVHGLFRPPVDGACSAPAAAGRQHAISSTR